MIGQVAVTSVAAQITAGKNGRMIHNDNAIRAVMKSTTSMIRARSYRRGTISLRLTSYGLFCDAPVLVDRRRLRGRMAGTRVLAEIGRVLINRVRSAPRTDVRSTPTSRAKADVPGLRICANFGSGHLSHLNSRLAVAVKPMIPILLSPAHAHLVVNHGPGVMPGGAQPFIFLDRGVHFTSMPQLRVSGGQNEMENGRNMLIHAVNLDDLFVIARQVVTIAQSRRWSSGE